MLSSHAVSCLDGAVKLVNSEVDLANQQPVYDFIKDEVARGRVELCVNNAFGRVCDVAWDNTDASVVCKQLGFSPYGELWIATSYFLLMFQECSVID